jgi:hypothetical protein
MTLQIWSIIGIAAGSFLALCCIYGVVSGIRRDLAQIKLLLDMQVRKNGT